jgi:hypothetical protein
MGIGVQWRAWVNVGLADGFPIRHFANTRASRIVRHEHQIAREEGRMRAAEIEEHTVLPGDGNDLELVT